MTCVPLSQIGRGLLSWAVVVIAAAGVTRGATLHPGLERVFIADAATEIAAIQVRAGKIYVYRAGADAVPSPLVFSPGEGKAAEPGPGLSLYRNQRLVTSADRNQVGLLTYQVIDGKGQQTRFDLLKENTKAWGVTVPGFADFSLSDDGSTVVGTLHDIHVPKAGRIDVYDTGQPEGKPLGTRRQPAIRKVEVSRDGSRIAVNTRDELIVLDRHAELQRSLGPALDFSLSRDGRGVVLLRRGEAIVALEGHNPYSLPTEGLARHATFSVDGAFLGIVDPKRLYFLRAASGTILYTRPAGEAAEFESVDLSPDGSRTLALQLTAQQRPTATQAGSARADLILLDAKGGIIEHQAFGLPGWNGVPPSIQFIDGRVLIDAGKQILHFTPEHP